MAFDFDTATDILGIENDNLDIAAGDLDCFAFFRIYLPLVCFSLI